jgi:hypothetical protein
VPENFEQIAIWWGPGILVLMGFGYGGLRLAHHWIEKSMELRRRQSEGMVDVARECIEQFLTAQRSQAEALSRLAASVEQRDTHESFEHQEMLIAIKAMHHEIGRMPCRGLTARECERADAMGS